MELRSKNILIIEDDPAIASGLEELLLSESFNAVVSATGLGGLAEARRNPPDLILLDLHLPGMNGLDVCRGLRSEGFISPILILTSRTEQIDKVVGLEAGADDYITKPFSTHELLARIRANLRRMERFKPKQRSVHPSKEPEGNLRRLLAIVFTDMQGYSTRMHEDEQATLELLETHNALIQRTAETSAGRVVDIIGDGFLLSFESVIHAAEFAVSIQKALVAYRETHTLKEAIHIRIGIHVGEVIEIDGGVRGDTVNTAARIQQITPPDSIYISQTVLDTVRNKTGIKTRLVGNRQLKHIESPVAIHEILYK